MNTEDSTVALTVRLPGTVHAEISTEADQDRRSINKEIVALVEEALASRRRRKAQRKGTAEEAAAPRKDAQ